MNLTSVGDAGGKTIEIKQEVKDAPESKRRIHRKFTSAEVSLHKAGSSGVDTHKLKLNAIDDLNHDCCNLLIMRKICEMDTHEVRKYLGSVGVHAEKILGGIKQFEEMLDRARKKVILSQVTMSEKGAKVSAPIMPLSANVFDMISDTSDTSDSSSDSDEETACYVPMDSRSGRKTQKRPGSDSLNAELEHRKYAKKMHFTTSTATGSSTTGTVNKVLAQQSSTSKAKSKCSSASQGAYKVDTNLQIPVSLGNLLDNILVKIKVKREETLFAQDIMSFWVMLASDSHGENVKKLLKAVVLPSDKGLAAIHSLQVELNPQEDRIDLESFNNLYKYFKKVVFNGKQVGFTLDDLVQLIRLMKNGGDDEFLNGLPPKLCFLVECLISRTLLLRYPADVSIKTHDFMERIREGALGECCVDLLGVICGKKMKVNKIKILQSKLENYKRDDFSVTEDRWVSSVDKELTINEVMELKDYFDQYFFKKWLLAFSSEDLRKYMQRNGSLKLDYSLVKRQSVG